MNKTEKDAVIADIEEKLQKASSVFLTDFTGINVDAMNQLRRDFDAKGAEFRVVKNTLAKIAFGKVDGYGGEQLEGFLKGPTAIALGYDDMTAPAKVITEFMKLHKKLEVKALYLQKELMANANVEDIAKMPTKQELLGMLVLTLQSPMMNLVSLLNANMQNLVGVLTSLKDQKQA